MITAQIQMTPMAQAMVPTAATGVTQGGAGGFVELMMALLGNSGKGITASPTEKEEKLQQTPPDMMAELMAQLMAGAQQGVLPDLAEQVAQLQGQGGAGIAGVGSGTGMAELLKLLEPGTTAINSGVQRIEEAPTTQQQVLQLLQRSVQGENPIQQAAQQITQQITQQAAQQTTQPAKVVEVSQTPQTAETLLSVAGTVQAKAQTVVAQPIEVAQLQEDVPIASTEAKGNQQQSGQPHKDAQEELLQSVSRRDTKTPLKAEEKSEKPSLEELQRAVDEGKFMAPRGAQSFTGELKKISKEQSLSSTEDFMGQIKSGVSTGLKGTNQEFIIKLKPEGLGEITVKLTNEAGKITLNLSASSQQTAKLLQAELPILRETLKPLGTEIGQVTHTATTFDASAFSQQQMLKQQQQQQFQNNHSHNRYTFGEVEEDATGFLSTAPQTLGSSALDRYI